MFTSASIPTNRSGRRTIDSVVVDFQSQRFDYKLEATDHSRGLHEDNETSYHSVPRLLLLPSSTCAGDSIVADCSIDHGLRTTRLS